jgi:DNA-binding GntR family transcriptional regulator
MEVPAVDPFELFEREKNQPIHQWVYYTLKMNIIRLRLHPGQEISEPEIASRMGISRTPVREAFIRLAEDGLLEVRPQRHTIVALIDLEQAEETRFVRMTLEKPITREACELFAGTKPAVLETNLLIQEECLRCKDYEGFLATDDEFHRTVYRSCGKERVWAFVKKLDTSHDRLRMMTLPLIGQEILAQHRAILELLVGGSVGGVDAVVEDHLTNRVIGRVILDYPESYFKQNPRDYARAAVTASAFAASASADAHDLWIPAFPKLASKTLL